MYANMSSPNSEMNLMYEDLDEEASSSHRDIDTSPNPDLNLYEDFLIQQEEKKKSDELSNLEEKLKKASAQIKALEEKCRGLEEDNSTLIWNISSLWKTSISQLREKATTIKKLSKEKEMIIFRRAMRQISKDELDRVVSRIMSYNKEECSELLKIIKEDKDFCESNSQSMSRRWNQSTCSTQRQHIIGSTVEDKGCDDASKLISLTGNDIANIRGFSIKDCSNVQPSLPNNTNEFIQGSDLVRDEKLYHSTEELPKIQTSTACEAGKVIDSDNPTSVLFQSKFSGWKIPRKSKENTLSAIQVTGSTKSETNNVLPALCDRENIIHKTEDSRRSKKLLRESRSPKAKAFEYVDSVRSSPRLKEKFRKCEVNEACGKNLVKKLDFDKERRRSKRLRSRSDYKEKSDAEYRSSSKSKYSRDSYHSRTQKMHNKRESSRRSSTENRSMRVRYLERKKESKFSKRRRESFNSRSSYRNERMSDRPSRRRSNVSSRHFRVENDSGNEIPTKKRKLDNNRDLKSTVEHSSSNKKPTKISSPIERETQCYKIESNALEASKRSCSSREKNRDQPMRKERKSGKTQASSTLHEASSLNAVVNSISKKMNDSEKEEGEISEEDEEILRGSSLEPSHNSDCVPFGTKGDHTAVIQSKNASKGDNVLSNVGVELVSNQALIEQTGSVEEGLLTDVNADHKASDCNSNNAYDSLQESLMKIKNNAEVLNIEKGECFTSCNNGSNFENEKHPENGNKQFSESGIHQTHMMDREDCIQSEEATHCSLTASKMQIPALETHSSKTSTGRVDEIFHFKEDNYQHSNLNCILQVSPNAKKHPVLASFHSDDSELSLLQFISAKRSLHNNEIAMSPPPFAIPSIASKNVSVDLHSQDATAKDLKLNDLQNSNLNSASCADVNSFNLCHINQGNNVNSNFITSLDTPTKSIDDCFGSPIPLATPLVDLPKDNASLSSTPTTYGSVYNSSTPSVPALNLDKKAFDSHKDNEIPSNCNHPSNTKSEYIDSDSRSHMQAISYKKSEIDGRDRVVNLHIPEVKDELDLSLSNQSKSDSSPLRLSFSGVLASETETKKKKVPFVTLSREVSKNMFSLTDVNHYNDLGFASSFYKTLDNYNEGEWPSVASHDLLMEFERQTKSVKSSCSSNCSCSSSSDSTNSSNNSSSSSDSNTCSTCNQDSQDNANSTASNSAASAVTLNIISPITVGEMNRRECHTITPILSQKSDKSIEMSNSSNLSTSSKKAYRRIKPTPVIEEAGAPTLSEKDLNSEERDDLNYQSEVSPHLRPPFDGHFRQMHSGKPSEVRDILVQEEHLQSNVVLPDSSSRVSKDLELTNSNSSLKSGQENDVISLNTYSNGQLTKLENLLLSHSNSNSSQRIDKSTLNAGENDLEVGDENSNLSNSANYINELRSISKPSNRQVLNDGDSLNTVFKDLQTSSSGNSNSPIVCRSRESNINEKIPVGSHVIVNKSSVVESEYQVENSQLSDQIPPETPSGLSSLSNNENADTNISFSSHSYDNSTSKRELREKENKSPSLVKSASKISPKKVSFSDTRASPYIQPNISSPANTEQITPTRTLKFRTPNSTIIEGRRLRQSLSPSGTSNVIHIVYNEDELQNPKELTKESQLYEKSSQMKLAINESPDSAHIRESGFNSKQTFKVMKRTKRKVQLSAHTSNSVN